MTKEEAVQELARSLFALQSHIDPEINAQLLSVAEENPSLLLLWTASKLIHLNYELAQLTAFAAKPPAGNA